MKKKEPETSKKSLCNKKYQRLDLVNNYMHMECDDKEVYAAWSKIYKVLKEL